MEKPIENDTQTVFEMEFEQDNPPNNEQNEFKYNENEVILLTPRQKMREWTRIYHKIRSIKWIQQNLGIPFWGLFKKYNQSRYLQKMWATRIMRREGLGDVWRTASLVSPTHIKIDDSKLNPKNDDDDDDDRLDININFEQKDLDYLLYYKAPCAYITDKDRLTHINNDNDKDDNDINLRETEDEQTIIHSLQYVFDTETNRRYWEALSNHEDGKFIFNAAIAKEHYFREDAKINAIRDPKTNLLIPKDPNKTINPYKILPEENPRSEHIQYGGKMLADYVDFKPERTKRLVNYNDNKNLLNDGIDNDNENVNENKSDKSDDGDKSDEFDYKETEGYKFNRSFGWAKAQVSGQSMKDHVADIEKISFDGINKDETRKVEDIMRKRRAIDMRFDFEKNPRYSGWYQLKHLLPTFEELGVLMKLKKLSLFKGINMVLDDYKFVFKNGGGELLRRGYPPQLSIQEFNVEDQFETSLGIFGANHSLFSDWFVAKDNKRAECDRSIGKAEIINDRLIFTGFLIHSCIEMAHRTRNLHRDFVGFVNLMSNEFEPEWDLHPYYSIGIKLRTDGRSYLLGLECLNRNKFMIFNGIISLPKTPDGEWDYYEIPIHHFRPYDRGQFIEGQTYMQARWLRSIGIQAIGQTGAFNLEIAWIRAFADNARFDVEDEEITFIQDIDAMGLYEADIVRFHIYQHQYFIDDFPDPFRFEDNGVFDDGTYLGPPRAQREHFAKLAPDLLKYIDLIDDIPLIEGGYNEKDIYYYLDDDDMYQHERFLTNKLIGTTKSVQHLYKDSNEMISAATNNLLYNSLKNQSKHNKYLVSSVYHNNQIHWSKENEKYSKSPFIFKDTQQTTNNPITILTQRRRELLRFAIPEHLREREPGKYPQLV